MALALGLICNLEVRLAPVLFLETVKNLLQQLLILLRAPDGQRHRAGTGGLLRFGRGLAAIAPASGQGGGQHKNGGKEQV